MRLTNVNRGKIIGRKKRDPQRRDIELIVYFFAMRDISNYEKPMKNYLSKYMYNRRNITNKDLDDDRKIFYQTCDNVVNHLGEKPFHLRTGLNPPALDSVMAIFSHYLDNIPDDIHKRYEILKKDKEFDETTRRGTNDKQAVNRRFQRVRVILFNEISS